MSCNAQNMSLIKIKRIIGILKAKKYIIYSQPYQLNMVGVRNKGTNPIKFDDRMYVFWKTDKNKWVGRDYAITTDPSTAWLKNPMNKVATAVLPNGQYVDAWKIGKHKGQYTALVQRKPFCVYRDYNRNAWLDFDVDSQTCGKFGINIHRGKPRGADDGQGNTDDIGLYSAGCQVFRNYYCFTDEFIPMLQKQQQIYGNEDFTYTLIDKWLTNQYIWKRSIYTAGIVSALGFIGYGWWLIYKQAK
tara:strand:- start:770 stop:1504 length:735 start_codon:yes stop_codon:yes gene_type:complete